MLDIVSEDLRIRGKTHNVDKIVYVTDTIDFDGVSQIAVIDFDHRVLYFTAEEIEKPVGLYKSGIIYGAHFCVYTGKDEHSEFLVRVMAREIDVLSMIASVRVAQSVRKRMIFQKDSKFYEIKKINV